MPSDNLEELHIFRLFFDDDTIVTSTNAYAEINKEKKQLTNKRGNDEIDTLVSFYYSALFLLEATVKLGM